MRSFDYAKAETLQQALELISQAPKKYTILAGGTDVLVNLKNNKISPQLLIDINKIPGLNCITKKGNYIELGALVTHFEATQSELILKYGKILAEASAKVGSPQIRNMGTIVGNVINAQPAADAAVALHALDAQLKVVQGGSERWLPVAESYLGLGKSALAGQLVTAIRFIPLNNRQGSSFKRIARRESLALPILNVAVVVQLEQQKFEWARIYAAPVGPFPMRMVQAEEYLKGKPAQDTVIKQAAAMAGQQAEPRNSLFRGTREYRKDIICSLIEEALQEASQEVLSKGR